MVARRIDAVIVGLNRFSGVSPIRPFTEFWRRYFAYEFGRTNKAACMEDVLDAADYDWPTRWSDVTMPVALKVSLGPV